ncbi:MAG TPA: hypothetical protein VGI10_27120 [Polyangiaceae bacterium]|jgi:hypothetical protein
MNFEAHRLRSVYAALAVFALSGCTALGPMPATTGISYVQEQRPDISLQGGFVPGYYLSTAVQENHNAAALGQIAALFEPDHWLSAPGLIVGARRAGSNESKPSLEPMIGYRTKLDADNRFNAGAVGFGTYAQGSKNGASFSATHGGVEGGLDARLTPTSKWLELHLNGSASFTALHASGIFCTDAQGQYGVDCGTGTPLTSAEASGIYPSVNGGLALDFARHNPIFFHGGRLAVDAGAGTMPTVIAGAQHNAKPYAYGGVTLTVALGDKQ